MNLHACTCTLRTSGSRPTVAGDSLLDDQLRLTADEAIKLADALINAARLIAG